MRVRPLAAPSLRRQHNQCVVRQTHDPVEQLASAPIVSIDGQDDSVLPEGHLPGREDILADVVLQL
eukprot:4395871-Alexandrium_andersonii.AAC.1